MAVFNILRVLFTNLLIGCSTAGLVDVSQLSEDPLRGAAPPRLLDQLLTSTSNLPSKLFANLSVPKVTPVKQGNYFTTLLLHLNP